MVVALFENQVKIGITATGTLRIDRKGVLDVKQLQKALSASNVLQGDGYLCMCGGAQTNALSLPCWLCYLVIVKSILNSE